jgi:pyrrolysine biosynthesis protein PylD
MTRLTSSDISNIGSRLKSHDEHLIASTGHDMLGIACKCLEIEYAIVRERAGRYHVRVVPVTAGEGLITTFSETIAVILNHLGFRAEVSDKTDVAGFSAAIEDGVDGIFMADDNRFIGYDIATCRIADNTELTGRIYATALSLMCSKDLDRRVLVIGCGPVGCSAARQLLQLSWDVALYDIDGKQAERVRQLLVNDSVRVEQEGKVIVERVCRPLEYNFIVDATPSGHVIGEEQLTSNTRMAIPGVPPGISAKSFSILGTRVVHDKLELGVAAMAVSLL